MYYAYYYILVYSMHRVPIHAPPLKNRWPSQHIQKVKKFY